MVNKSHWLENLQEFKKLPLLTELALKEKPDMLETNPKLF